MPEKERRLLDDGATALEARLLMSAKHEPALDPAARERAIERIKIASQAAVVVGAGFFGARWLFARWATLSKGLAIVGIGTAVTAGVVGWQKLRDRTPPSETAKAVSSPVPMPSAPPIARAAVSGAAADARSTITPPAMSEVLQAEPLPPTTSARAERTVSAASRSAKAPFDRDPESRAADTPPAAQVASPSSEREPGAREDAVLAASSGAPEASDRNVNSLREETALLETARQQIASAQGAQALIALRQYDERYRGGVLGEDAAVLRIKAHIAVGNLISAREAVRSLERQYPESSYLPRVRALVEKK